MKLRTATLQTAQVWQLGESFKGSEWADILARIDGIGPGMPVVLSLADYSALDAGLSSAERRTGAAWPTLDGQAVLRARDVLRNAVTTETSIAVLLPGPYSACRGPVIDGGGKSLVRASTPNRVP